MVICWFVPYVLKILRTNSDVSVDDLISGYASSYMMVPIYSEGLLLLSSEIIKLKRFILKVGMCESCREAIALYF